MATQLVPSAFHATSPEPANVAPETFQAIMTLAVAEIQHGLARLHMPEQDIKRVSAVVNRGLVGSILAALEFPYSSPGRNLTLTPKRVEAVRAAITHEVRRLIDTDDEINNAMVSTGTVVAIVRAIGLFPVHTDSTDQ